MNRQQMADLTRRLRASGIRPTRQRIFLAEFLFADGAERHVSVEQMRDEAVKHNVPVALATIYNTLHQFTRSGLLREVTLPSGQVMFDTNIEPHHHFWHEASGQLSDIPASAVRIDGLPPAPAGHKIDAIEVIVHLKKA